MGLNETPPETLQAVGGASCRNLVRIWLALSFAWVAFVGWRAAAGWPVVPLDMGGIDAARDSAYQAALFRHTSIALGLAIGAPVLAYILGRLACRFPRR